MSNGRPLYEHTQVGWAMLLGMIPLAITYYLSTLRGPHIPFHADVAVHVALVVAGIVLLLMCTLTISLDRRVLRWRFGPGPFAFSLAITEIESVQVARVPLSTGFGIRLTRRGWVYNVSGCTVVEIRRKNGRTTRVGSDDAEHLVRAIERVLKEAQR